MLRNNQAMVLPPMTYRLACRTHLYDRGTHTVLT